MKRSSLVVVSLVGVLASAACGQRARDDSAAAATSGTERVVAAVTATPSLAYPEYDLDVPVEFFDYGSQPTYVIYAKMVEGFRLVSISAAAPFLYNATFVRNDDPLSPYYRTGNDWQTGLTEGDLLAIQGTDRRIVDIAAYIDGGQRRYAAVWIDNTGTQQVDYKLILHTTPGDFVAQTQPDAGAPLGWRVVDVETVPVPGGAAGQFEVSGVAIKNIDTATTRQQWFGYGPLAGNNVAAPADATQVQTMSLGKQVSDQQARTMDLSSPFGDENFFWVAESTLDSPAPGALADGDHCLDVPDASTERNWWFGDQRIESASDDPGKEDFLSHSLLRFGGRTTKLKSYNRAKAGGAVRYAGVIADNGSPAPTGNSSSNPVLKKVDAAMMNRLKRWGLPGGALALVKNGQLIYARGYGYANLGGAAPRLVQPDDLFRLASVSKPINESLLLRLLNNDKDTKPVHTLTGGPVTLQTKPFGEIFEYTPPPGITGCPVDDPTALDATTCNLGDIRLNDLVNHTTGLQNLGRAGTPESNWLFSYDLPSALEPADWIKREKYWDCLIEQPDLPLICVRPGAFAKPPGVQSVYMNAEYQMILAVVEKLSGMKYEDYLAEVLAPLYLDKLRPAHYSESPDPAGIVQTIPYTIPIPAFFGIPELPVRSADKNVYPLAAPLDPSIKTHGYMGSASIAASMIDLVRWGTSVNGSRGGYRIFSSVGGPVADDAFNTQFRSGDPSCRGCPGPGGTTAYPFEHGGLFNFDAQARIRMLPNGITYAFAANGDSLQADVDYCCPGTTTCAPTAAPPSCATTAVKTTRFTHGNPLDGTFDTELRDDLDNILGGGPATPGCAQSLPDVDLFSQYHSQEPHALCTNVSLPAGPACTATIDVTTINAGSSGGTLSLTSASTFGVGTWSSGLAVTNSLGVSQCGARVVVTDVTPPTLTVPPAVNKVVCAGGGTVTIGQATATDNCRASPQVIGYVVSKDGVPLSPPILVSGGQATLTPGVYVVHWTANDGALSVGNDQSVVVTADPTVPVLTAPPNVSVKTCQTHTVVSVGQATATDNCPLTVTGQVIASNGVTLSPPITISGGQVDLGVGTHTIQWTATDGVNSAVPITRTATVSPAIQASQSFDVQDRGQIRTTSSTFAAVLNSGTLSTHVGQFAHTAAILSVAPVTIDNGATVDGNVTSGGTINKNPGASAGTLTEHATVVLPALPTLPTFPTATGGFDVNSGTRNQAPGSFTTVNVNAGTLVLASGDYFFQTLTLNSNGTVRVTPTTRVFVRDSLNYSTPFRATSGTAIQPITLGYAGTATLFMNIRFDGMLMAPNATASLGAGAGVTFTGSFYGKKLQVNPASALVCSP